MRVVSGKARGLKLNTIESNLTRPTKDMVKEALFSMLNSYVQDSIFLDLFSGSGAIAIEALSRGAKKAYLVDSNKDCINVIKDNIERAKFSDSAIIIHEDYQKALESFKEVKFDIIYIDPPYNKGLGVDAIEKISSFDMLNGDGVLVFETDDGEEAPELIGKYEKFKLKKYGRNILNFYKERSVE